MIERLVVENLDWFRKKAQRYYSDECNIDDLVSETIERILKFRNRYDARMSFRPWALTVMHNVFITHYNRQKSIAFEPLDDAFRQYSTFASDQDEAVRYILSTIRKCARESIAIECVILYAKGYTYSEISSMLSIPIGTVMSRISNGRKMLKDALGIPKVTKR